MAVTFTFTEDARGRSRIGRGKEVRGRIELDAGSTYATGGFAVTADDFQLGLLDSVYPMPPFEGTAGYTAAWDSANGNILMYWGDNDAAADGTFVEVANTTDVAGVTLDVLVRGVG